MNTNISCSTTYTHDGIYHIPLVYSPKGELKCEITYRQQTSKLHSIANRLFAEYQILKETYQLSPMTRLRKIFIIISCLAIFQTIIFRSLSDIDVLQHHFQCISLVFIVASSIEILYAKRFGRGSVAMVASLSLFVLSLQTKLFNYNAFLIFTRVLISVNYLFLIFLESKKISPSYSLVRRRWNFIQKYKSTCVNLFHVYRTNIKLPSEREISKAVVIRDKNERNNTLFQILDLEERQLITWAGAPDLKAKYLEEIARKRERLKNVVDQLVDCTPPPGTQDYSEDDLKIDYAKYELLLRYSITKAQEIGDEQKRNEELMAIVNEIINSESWCINQRMGSIMQIYKKYRPQNEKDTLQGVLEEYFTHKRESLLNLAAISYSANNTNFDEANAFNKSSTQLGRLLGIPGTQNSVIRPLPQKILGAILGTFLFSWNKQRFILQVKTWFKRSETLDIDKHSFEEWFKSRIPQTQLENFVSKHLEEIKTILIQSTPKDIGKAKAIQKYFDNHEIAYSENAIARINDDLTTKKDPLIFIRRELEEAARKSFLYSLYDLQYDERGDIIPQYIEETDPKNPNKKIMKIKPVEFSDNAIEWFLIEMGFLLPVEEKQLLETENDSDNFQEELLALDNSPAREVIQLEFDDIDDVDDVDDVEDVDDDDIDDVDDIEP